MTNNMLKTAFKWARTAIESEEDETVSQPFKPTSCYLPEPETGYLTRLEQQVHTKPLTLKRLTVQILWPRFDILT